MFAPLTPEEVADAERKKAPKSVKTPIIPVPADAPPMAFRHPKRKEPPSKAWPYHDSDGRLVGYVCRWDFTNEAGERDKDFLPVTFCDLGNGKRRWSAKGMPAPRPLFGLPDLLARPDAWVLICEGEKARDAGAVLFPDMVATTPAHGAKSPHQTDFSPCAGRVVVIATDHDEPGKVNPKGEPHHPGRDFGDEVCELMRDAGAVQILHLHPERLGAWLWRDGVKAARGVPLPDGWDVADALSEGWTAEAVAELRRDPGFLAPYLIPDEGASADEDDDGPAPRAGHFRLTPTGVEKRVEHTDKETGRTSVEWRWFCSNLEVIAETRNADSEEWGRLLRLTDRDGKQKDWAMPMSMLAGDGTAYRERLLSLGLIMAPGRFARDALHDYISTASPPAKARCVNRIGWHGRAFVLPDSTMGDTAGEVVLLQTDGPSSDHAFRIRGTLASWQTNVGRYAVGNSRLIIALSAAFAAPLLHLSGAESGGFHLRGASSTGKSTALVVAGSVWGGGGVKGYVRQWRATDNGLESVAVGHCDALLCLDELSQISPESAGAAAYMLANGAGKTRAGRNGEGRAAAEWRSLFLSSGEMSIADKIAEGGRGRRAAAGQTVRVVDIPADAGAGRGLFEELHGFPSADTFARHLKAAAVESFGTAARAFLDALAKAPDEATETLAKYRSEFLEQHVPVKSDGQVFRVGIRFALVAAAGEMATAFGVLPWSRGEATMAAAHCFRAWVEMRGGVASAEDGDAISAVRRFIELHGVARFEPMGALVPTDASGAPLEVRVFNRAGFRRFDDSGGVEYFILPEVWRAEVCAGQDAVAVAKALVARGLLVPSKDGKFQDRQRLPGFSSPVRCYRVTAGILSDSDND